MQIMPILSTLRRHRLAAALIVLEIALTCAIVSNAIFLISDRLNQVDRPSGVAEDEIVRVQVTGIGQKEKDGNAVTEQDLSALRSIAGVKYVAATNMVPFGNSSWNNSMSTKPEDNDPPVNAAMYMGSLDLVEAYGVRLIAGRDFQASEYVELDGVQAGTQKIPSVIVTKGLADKLYPGQDPLGKPLYVWPKDASIITGVVERIARPNEFDVKAREYAAIIPVRVPYTTGGNYILRVDPARTAEVVAALDGALNRVDPNRIILERQTFAQIRAKYFAGDKAMAYVLVGVCVALLVITALGIVGLASFWVQQRTRQIGIRRALGATRGDIRRYFQTENFILATMGIALGMAMAFGMNLLLMKLFAVPRLPAEFLPVGALLLWILGQIAVLAPARRASLIPPATATRML